MSKKITVVLSDEAEAYFNELKEYYNNVACTLDCGKEKVNTYSSIINRCLLDLKTFENTMQQDIITYLMDISR